MPTSAGMFTVRMLRKHACIRSRGGSEDGAPVYVLNR